MVKFVLTGLSAFLFLIWTVGGANAVVMQTVTATPSCNTNNQCFANITENQFSSFILTPLEPVAVTMVKFESDLHFELFDSDEGLEIFGHRGIQRINGFTRWIVELLDRNGDVIPGFILDVPLVGGG